MRAHWRGLLLLVGTLLAWYRWPTLTVTLWVCVWVWFTARWVRNRYQLADAAGEPRETWQQLLSAWWRESRRRIYLAGQWQVACLSNRLVSKEKVTPRLFQVQGTLAGDLTARFTGGRIGVLPDDVAKNAPRIAKTVGCREVMVKETAPGCADIHFLWSDPLARLVPIADLPPAPKGMIAYGVRRSKQAAYIRRDQSCLIGGLTGQGKSAIIRALLADLIRQNIPTELYVSDPKDGIELSYLSAHVGEQMGCLKVVEYCDNPQGVVAMVKRAHAHMQSRPKVRKHKPTKAQPLVIVLIDELLPLTQMIKQGTAGEIGKILYMGRARGFVAWMNSQVGHASVIGDLRNLIPQRICFATPTAETTDTILGSQSEARGATCSKLDRRTSQGLGFSADEEGHLAPFRAAYVSDKRVDGATDLERIAAGRMPLGMKRGRHDLYRFFNSDGVLLYIGESKDAGVRAKQHARSQPWWPEVDESRTVVRHFATQEEALAAEEAAIKAECPLYNVKHNARRLPQVSLPQLRRPVERVEVGPPPGPGWWRDPSAQPVRVARDNYSHMGSE